MTKRSPFKYFKTSPEIIRLAVMLYVRFPLSLRNVEDLLHERGIEISHETVRFCWQRFRPLFASEIRKRRIAGLKFSRWQWHLDEVFVKVNGERHYLWRAVDHEGEVLESFVTKTRDKKAALKFLRKAMRKHGRPENIITDFLRSYGAELKELGALDRQKLDVGLTTEPKTHICHSGDENERCNVLGVCEVCRCSFPSMPQSQTTSTWSAVLLPDHISS